MSKVEFDELITQAAAVFPALAHEGWKEIVGDLEAAEREAALQEKKFKFTLRFAVVVGTEKTTHTLSWSTGHKLSAEAERKDPNQPDLPGTTDQSDEREEDQDNPLVPEKPKRAHKPKKGGKAR